MTQNGEKEGSQRAIWKKKVFTLLGVILTLFLLFWGYVAWRVFDIWRGQKGVELTYQLLKKEQEELYQKQLADTYGGKTPQETLQLYINAVEKGDYELASRYFVIEKQEEWRKELNEIKVFNKLDVFLNPIKEARQSLGEYSEDKKSFSIYEPIGIDFILYPNDIWKIVEI